MVLAQFDFGTGKPSVRLPSLTLGSNAISVRIGKVVTSDRVERRGSVHVVELADELFERARGHLRHLADAVLVAQEMRHLLVEDLPRELARLPQNDRAILGIGVVAEVGTLVDEALTVGVEHDAPGIGVLLKAVADCEIAKLGRIAVPAHGVAAGPVAARRCAAHRAPSGCRRQC